MKVAILGAGPAGLIGAHAAVELGHEVAVYSRKEPSKMYGAMFLHAPVPNVSPKVHELEIVVDKLGTRGGYAMNVYGDPKAPVSWDRFDPGTILAWSLPKTYRKLWTMYEGLIIPCEITPFLAMDIRAKSDVMFSTLPATMMCNVWGHNFKSQAVVIVHGPNTDGPELRNRMVYNGSLGEQWYRYSIINRYESWEYRDGNIPYHVEKGAVEPQHIISQGMKPLWTDCDCHPDIIRLGRFGQWDKNVFVHHSYEAVRNALH